MKIGILTIGNELMNGRTADTNSSFIAREINAQGWQVEVMMSAGDDEEAIKARLHYMLSLADAVICTGGLGPTADDITTAAVARAFSLPLVMDDNVLNHLRDIFTRYNLRWTENNANGTFPRRPPVIPPCGHGSGFVLAVKELVFVIREDAIG